MLSCGLFYGAPTPLAVLACVVWGIVAAVVVQALIRWQQARLLQQGSHGLRPWQLCCHSKLRTYRLDDNSRAGSTTPCSDLLSAISGLHRRFARGSVLAPVTPPAALHSWRADG